MANEFTVGGSISVNVGRARSSVTRTGVRSDLSGTLASAARTIGLTTAEQALPMGDVSSPGWTWLQSLEADGGSNIVWGVKPAGTFLPFGKLLPGEPALIRMAGVPVYAKSVGASADLYFWISEQ